MHYPVGLCALHIGLGVNKCYRKITVLTLRAIFCDSYFSESESGRANMNALSCWVLAFISGVVLGGVCAFFRFRAALKQYRVFIESRLSSVSLPYASAHARRAR